jgi:hypothetical protein
VKGLTIMVNSISNGARMEDVWLVWDAYPPMSRSASGARSALADFVGQRGPDKEELPSIRQVEVLDRTGQLYGTEKTIKRLPPDPSRTRTPPAIRAASRRKVDSPVNSNVAINAALRPMR